MRIALKRANRPNNAGDATAPMTYNAKGEARKMEHWEMRDPEVEEARREEDVRRAREMNVRRRLSLKKLSSGFVQGRTTGGWVGRG